MSHSHDHAPPGHPTGLRRQVTRRALVQDFGRGTLAIALLGSGVATVACGGSDSTDEAAPRVAAPTNLPASTSTPVDGADAADTALRWEQVSFGFVSAFILARGNEFAVVDTGTAGNEAAIGSALRTLGATYDDLDHVVLTHLHADHVGSLPGVLDNAPQATAYAGEADIAAIISPRPLKALNHGDDVFGLRVVATPGHTPGHICLVDETSQLLIAGDALVESNGAIAGAPEQFTDDLALSISSVKALADWDFDTALFGHGNPIESGAGAAFATYLATV